MINKLMAIAAIMMTPSLASAQSSGSSRQADTGNVQQFNGALSSDTTDTTRRDTTRSDTSMMMNQSDTMMMDTTRTDTMMMDTTRTDTSMMNQTDTTMYRPDTTMNRDTTDTTRFHTDTARTDTSTTTVESHGRLYTPPGHAMLGRNMGLSADQVEELQKAVNDAGCHAGPVDGLIGPQTREGIACVREQKGIQGDQLNDVLSALGLSFTAPSDARVPRSRNENVKSSDSTMYRTDTTTPSTYQTDTSTTPTMDTTRSVDSSMVTDTTVVDSTTTTTVDTTRSVDTTTTMDTTTPPDTSSAYPTDTTTNPSDSTMNPMNPMHPTDTTTNQMDTTTTLPDTTMRDTTGTGR